VKLPDTQSVLNSAEIKLHNFASSGFVFDLLTLGQPRSHQVAIETAKIVSKLSPILGNMIEFSFAEVLNQIADLRQFGTWVRQDPGFPDTIFDGAITPLPGFEIKAWFPLATEITARFKDSQLHFEHDNTRVALLAWLPEKIIYGRPRLIDVCVVSGSSIAKARDQHYHNPPGYIVQEPGDTASRTKNLQQTNTNGFKFQGSKSQLDDARELVRSLAIGEYSPSLEYQQLLRQLTAQFSYRLDTNYAKLDRIEHQEIERFKKRVLQTVYCGMSIAAWGRLFSGAKPDKLSTALEKHLGL
jgi:hypothetical protein